MTQAANLAALGSNASSTGTLGANSFAASTIPNSALSANPTFRNRIINGNMMIDQRYAGGAITPGAAYAYCVDRWSYGLSQASKLTFQQSTTAPAGFYNSIKISVASAYSPGAGDRFIFYQPIEGTSVSDIAWGTASAKTITISFQVYSSITGTFSCAVGNITGTYSYAFTYTVSAANTWTTVTATIPGVTAGAWNLGTSSAAIYFYINLGSGSNYLGAPNSWSNSFFEGATGQTSFVANAGAIMYITGVQLEVGSAASPFENRLYTTELQLCQRYYERSYDIGTATATFGNGWSGFATGSNSTGEVTPNIIFKVTKRAVPTVVGYNAVSGASNAVYRVSDAASIGINYMNYIGTNQVGLINLASGNSNSYYVSWTATAEL